MQFRRSSVGTGRNVNHEAGVLHKSNQQCDLWISALDARIILVHIFRRRAKRYIGELNGAGRFNCITMLMQLAPQRVPEYRWMHIIKWWLWVCLCVCCASGSSLIFLSISYKVSVAGLKVIKFHLLKSLAKTRYCTFEHNTRSPLVIIPHGTKRSSYLRKGHQTLIP